MTPIPADVAAAIGAAGHTIRASLVDALGASRNEWVWSGGELRESPAWRVTIGDGYGRGPTPRAATLDAFERMAAMDKERAEKALVEAKRVRLPYRKAQEMERAERATKHAADVRALAERVAAMWPEVTP